MSLAYVLEAAPAAEVAQFYKEVEGKFVLDVEGVVPASKVAEVQTKLDEFRTNNVELKKQLEKVVGQSLNGVKPEQVNVEQILEQKVAEMKTNFTTQVNALTQEKQQLATHLERVVLSDSVTNAAIKYGVQESALPDVLNRAKETFTVVDGVAVAKDKKLDKDGNPYTITNWIQSLAETASHLFAPSRGSGSQKPIKGGHVQQPMSSTDKISAGLAKLNK